ncbi:hypothetical protein OEZ85_002434 [Tetradesmus obliquus]|uniref:RCC1-like domain-containing protein n=1 Tax=Tetradesmus obliquus TaxID=3088 RepID=A0ABY8U1N3_TETOB|nr:hypothetical protein OEZ85_002434 [Tetradesmus obliquus]
MSEKSMSHAASAPLDLPDSPAGYLCLNVPPWVAAPPIEAVVFGWGASEDQQLGLDAGEDVDSPKVVEALLGVKFMGRGFLSCPLVGGSRNTLAIDAEGGLWSWGWNARGTLGHGHRDLQHKPACVEALHGVTIVQAAIGGWHCLALSDEGQVYCWGGNEYQQCGLVAPDEQPQPGTQAAAAQAAAEKAAHSSQGGTQSLLAAAAAAVAKGADAITNGRRSLVRSDTDVDSYPNGGTNGDAYTYSSVYGVLPAARDILVPRACMPGLVVKQVACGGMNSVVLTEGGEVWTWGEPWGEFALELQRAPRKVPGAVNIAAIACGAFHNMALARDGCLLAWGTNDYGQLGNGSTIYSTTPVEVVDLEEVAVADIAAGGWHSMALSADGQIYVWGRGEYGRLGIADRTGSSKLRPHKVRGLEGHTVVQVAAGGTHSVAVTSAGRMFIWGRASYGRLGLGPGARDAYSPVEVALPGGHERWKVAAATAGGRHTMCLAVPVRDASLRREGSRAGSTASTSRGPSRAASVQGEPAGGQQQQALLQQLQTQQQMSRGAGATGSFNSLAAELGGLRVGSPAPGSSGSGSGLAGLQQQRQKWGGGGGGLRPGEQAPVSPRAVPPPMSPSQRRVGFDLGSALNSEPGAVEAEGSIPTHNEGLLHSEAAAEDEAAQQEEAAKQREQAAMDAEAAAQARQQHEFGALHQAAATVDLSASIDDEVATAAAADPRQQQQQQHELQQQQQQQQRPATSPRLLALQQQAAGSSSSSMRRSGSYQGLSALHLHSQPGNSPRSGELAGASPSSLQQAMHAGGSGGAAAAAAASGGASTPPLVGQITRQQSSQLAAAVAGSHGRVDASRAASAASLPSLSAGVGVGPGVGGSSRMGPAVTRVDSDLSQEGMSPDEGLLLGGESPTGSSSGRGAGASRSNSERALAGLEAITGTSPPGGVYDVGLGDAAARCANSHPGREYIHYNTHLS